MNHYIWQEFHTVLWDSAQFYTILHIMVSYRSLWLHLDFKAGFYEGPFSSAVFFWILFGTLNTLLYLNYFGRFLW